MKTQEVIICTGGQLGDWCLPYIKKDAVLIGVDRGSAFLVEHGFIPDMAVGDFDSVTPEVKEHIRAHSKQMLDCDPIDKDFTDTEIAFRLAMDMRPSSITVIGAIGTRFDHSFANVQLLAIAVQNDLDAVIIGEHNQIRVIKQQLTVYKSRFSNVSLLPLTPSVTGIYLHGFQYPLVNATLTLGQSLGVSNVLSSDSGQIDINEGLLLVIQSND